MLAVSLPSIEGTNHNVCDVDGIHEDGQVVNTDYACDAHATRYRPGQQSAYNVIWFDPDHLKCRVRCLTNFLGS